MPDIQSYHALQAKIARAMSVSARREGLCFAGSRRRSTQDQQNDLYCVAVAESKSATQIADAWLCFLALHPSADISAQKKWTLLNVVTKDWLRCDLVIACGNEFTERSQRELKAVYNQR